MTENPFDQLGIKKELIKQLVRTGQLDDYLRDYRRITLTRIHPDKGGDNGLSALVNSAIDNIQHCTPSEIERYIAGMQNGNSEYLGVIEGLTGEVERLRKVENDYEVLRVKHAELLSSRSGADDEKVKTAVRSAPKPSRVPIDDFETREPEVRAAPRVKTPPTSTRREEPEPKETKREGGAEKIIGKYVIIPTSTYALGVSEVGSRATEKIGQPKFVLGRGRGDFIYRPFSFKENMIARIEAYESESEAERFKLFDTWLDSCTGIAYKKETRKFKIVPVCKNLITIRSDLRGAFLPINYGELEGVELDSSKGKYNQSLSKPEILKHKAWRACAEDDIPLLRSYRDVVFAGYKAKYKTEPEKLMGFYVRENTSEDELRAVFLNFLGCNSIADGDFDLNYYGRFLLGSPSVAKK